MQRCDLKAGVPETGVPETGGPEMTADNKPVPDLEAAGTSGSGSRKQVLQKILQGLRPIRGLPGWARYGLATLTVLTFAGIRVTLAEPMAADPYLLFFPPIILASFAFDRGSGFYATILSAALSKTNGGVPGLGEGISLAIFVIVGLFCAAIVEALRLTVDELGAREDDLQRDIEERKRAETALSDSEARFRATFELAGAGVALVGLDGMWLRVNRRLCDALGYTQEELLARTFQDITHPDDLDQDLAYVEQLLAGEIPLYRMEKRCFRKDRSLLWILLTVALVRSDSGQAQYFISVIQDISDRKKAEQALTQDRDELERLVEQRTAALMRAAEDRRRAEDALRQGEKLQAIGQLTGGVAHDFNNFLQVVGGGLQLLRRSVPEDRRLQILDGMEKATKNATDLTGRLLAFARKQALQPETIDLNARLVEMTGMLRHTIDGHIELVTDFAPDLWPVRVDPHQLEVSLVNLVVNARDAMAGGGTLSLITRNGVAESAATGAMSEHVDLTVRDTGEGMSSAILSRVFEPFFTTKGPEKGTGLGLAQVHGFVKQSGGDVFVESTPGQGTAITLRLGRAPADIGAPQREAAVEQMMGRAEGRCVLVVDDNPDVAAFATAMLAELGYHTCHAPNASEALAMLESGAKIDAVFSDIVMPGAMNGLDFATRLRECRPEVAVVLATGYSDALTNWQGARLWEILNKPYRLDELGAALERALAGKPRISAVPMHDDQGAGAP